MNKKQYIVFGISQSGTKIRPSDWSERLLATIQLLIKEKKAGQVIDPQDVYVKHYPDCTALVINCPNIALDETCEAWNHLQSFIGLHGLKSEFVIGGERIVCQK